MKNSNNDDNTTAEELLSEDSIPLLPKLSRTQYFYIYCGLFLIIFISWVFGWQETYSLKDVSSGFLSVIVLTSIIDASIRPINKKINNHTGDIKELKKDNKEIKENIETIAKEFEALGSHVDFDRHPERFKDKLSKEVEKIIKDKNLLWTHNKKDKKD